MSTSSIKFRLLGATVIFVHELSNGYMYKTLFANLVTYDKVIQIAFESRDNFKITFSLCEGSQGLLGNIWEKIFKWTYKYSVFETWKDYCKLHAY